MNELTRIALLNYLEAVENLATAVSSFAGTEAVSEVYETGRELQNALRNDETVVDTRF